MTEPSPAARAWLLTPPGVGAMAVIRLQSPGVVDIVRRFFKPKRRPLPSSVPVDRLYYGWFVDEDENIDDGILVFHSREAPCDTVDMTVHGGLRIVERMLMLLEHLGARIEPAGRDDFGARTLIDREVVTELASAKTERAVRFLAAQRRLLPNAFHSIADTGVDSPDESRRALRELKSRYIAARFLIDGANVAFCGPTNSGKSTLVNACFRSGRNLTSPEAGTTLDWVDTETAVDGIPLRVVDTAGVREQADPIEQAAIDRARAQQRAADVRVLVLDAAAPLPELVDTEFEDLLGDPNVVVAMNKSDLPSAWPDTRIRTAGVRLRTSGLSGAGLDDLGASIVNVLSIAADACERPALFTPRQVDAVTAILSDDRPGRIPDAVRALI